MLAEEIIDQIADRLEDVNSKDTLLFIKDLLEQDAQEEGEQAGFDGDQMSHSYKEGSFRDKAWQKGYQIGIQSKDKHNEQLIILDAIFIEGEIAFEEGKNVRENPHKEEKYRETWFLGFWHKGEYKCDFSNFLSQLK